MSDFFELWDQVEEVPGRWWLRTPENRNGWVDPCLFTGGGGPVAVEGPLVVKLRHDGIPLDYTMASHGMPVASERAAQVFTSVASDELQLIPVTVEGHREPYFVVHALHAIECVDETRSEGVKVWTEADEHPIPERLGEYRGIDLLRIDPSRVAGHHFFRVKRWEVALIVSARLREEMERAKLLGIHFNPV